MSISQKKAKRILKRALKVGVRECALEEGKSEATIERYCRLAKAAPAQARKTVDDLYAEHVAEEGGGYIELCRDHLEACASEHASLRAQNIAYYTGQDITAVAEPTDNRPMAMHPDLHGPYNHPEAIEFLSWVRDFRGCQERVVNVGDLFDFHAQSRFVSELDAYSPKEEYKKALEFTKQYTDAFPVGDIVLGNHDQIPQRGMKEAGILVDHLEDDHKLYGLPDSWNIHKMYHVVKPYSWNVLVEHGIGSGGMYGCANTSKEKGCSYVQGHTHSAAAVIYKSTYSGTTFGMNVGCLVDGGSLAMRYGKYGTKKGVLACGVVYGGSHAEVITMETWRNYKVWF